MRRALMMVASDLKNTSRDGLLLAALLLSPFLAVLIRFGVPSLRDVLYRQLAFDLAPHYPFITAMYLLMAPLTLGAVAGFMILDERDANVLKYFAVTPLTGSGYLWYRLASPVAASVIAGVAGVWVVGLTAAPASVVVPVAVLAAVEAPMIALFMGSFAANKVEGMALSKGLNLLSAGPVLGYLLRSRWHLVGGIAPPYWVTQAFVAGIRGEAWYVGYLAGGVVVHLAVLWGLARVFAQRNL